MLRKGVREKVRRKERDRMRKEKESQNFLLETESVKEFKRTNERRFRDSLFKKERGDNSIERRQGKTNNL